MKPILIISYINPDLDGVACAYAYAELLNAQGTAAEAGVIDMPQTEVEFPFRFLNLPFPQDVSASWQAYDKVIMLDNSSIINLPAGFDAKRIIEIIDHRKVTYLEPFINSKNQIELVGSCATLIAEKFHHAHMTPSRESAALLLTTIISNTINFKTSNTTDRDRAMAAWLAPIAHLPADYMHSFFEAKSHFSRPLKQVLIDDYNEGTFGGKRFSITQLEILRMEQFLNEHRTEITKVLRELQDEMKLDSIILNGIDIEEARTIMFAPDAFSQSVYGKILHTTFTDSIAHIPHILPRKEISPLLKAEFAPKP